MCKIVSTVSDKCTHAPAGSPLRRLEIRHLSVVAPVAAAAPAQRLILGPADLARARVPVAVKLGLGAAVQPAALSEVRVDGRGARGRCLGCGIGGGGGARLGSGGVLGLKGRGHGGAALQTLKLGLLLRGQLGRAGGGAKVGGVATAGGDRTSAEGLRHGAL